MNYAEWIDRARHFIARFKQSHPRMKTRLDIQPAASPSRIAEAEKGIGRPLPRAFREFLSTASGGCSFGYWWEPESDAEIQAMTSTFGLKSPICGGLESFAAVDHLARDYEYHRDLVEEGAYGDLSFCRDPLPIGSMGNGDHVALDLNGRSVVFLAHDGVSYLLAPDFDAFLALWEAIGYLDFGMSFHEEFVDPRGGGIEASDTPRRRLLMDLLLPSPAGH